MHHTLGLYGRYQHQLLHLYTNLAKLARFPLVGAVVRQAGNLYGRLGHSGYSLTLAEAEQIVDSAPSVALGPCSCRAEFQRCENPIMAEIVLGDGSSKIYASREKEFRSITREEAKEVLREAHRNHLAQSIMRCGSHFYAICNCCSCCCVPSRLRSVFGIKLALVRNPAVVQTFQSLVAADKS
jgi:hypothetical protein